MRPKWHMKMSILCLCVITDVVSWMLAAAKKACVISLLSDSFFPPTAAHPPSCSLHVHFLPAALPNEEAIRMLLQLLVQLSKLLERTQLCGGRAFCCKQLLREQQMVAKKSSGLFPDSVACFNSFLLPEVPSRSGRLTSALSWHCC